MVAFVKRASLDQWAVALDARTDAEALAALQRIKARADGVCTDLISLVSSLSGAPWDAADYFGKAYWDVYEGTNRLAEAVTAFKRHERGEQ
jgi:hypothetical protein